MIFHELPAPATPLQHNETLEIWLVVRHEDGEAVLITTKEDGDPEERRCDLGDLDSEFDDALNVGMFHEIMDRASLIADLFDRQIVGTLAVTHEPRLKKAADKLMTELANFYGLAGQVFCEKEDDDTSNVVMG